MTENLAEVVDAGRSILVVVDVQARLAPHIADHERVEQRCLALVQGAGAVGVPVLLTEHCPEAIGPTLASLRELVPPSQILGKRHFSAMDEAALPEALGQAGRTQVLVGGMEAHVCVLQTVLGIVAAGYDCWVIRDACGSRSGEDRLAAFERARAGGARLVTAEMVLFEWLRGADHPAFKRVHGLIKGF